jgi:hypothetical protein
MVRDGEESLHRDGRSRNCKIVSRHVRNHGKYSSFTDSNGISLSPGTSSNRELSSKLDEDERCERSDLSIVTVEGRSPLTLV